MLPTLKSGELVIFRPFHLNNKLLKEGVIVVVNHPLKSKKIIVKRVHRISPAGVELLGDNQKVSTDSRHFGFVRKENIKGIVECSIFQKKIF